MKPFQQLSRFARVYLRTFHLIWEAGPKDLLITLSATVLSGLAIPAQVWISRIVIDQVAAAINNPSPGIQVQWMALAGPAALYLVVWAAAEVCRAVSQSIQQVMEMKIGKHAQHRLLAKASNLSISFFENPAYQDKLELAHNQIWRAENIPHMLFAMLSHTITVVALLAMLAQVTPLLPLILLVSIVPRMIAYSNGMNREARFWLRNTPIQRMDRYLSASLASREMAKEMRLFHLQNHFLSRFREITNQFIGEYRQLKVSREKVNLALTLPAVLGTAGVWFYTIYNGLLGRISVGDVALVFQSTEQSRSALEQLFMLLGVFLEYGLYLENYFEYLDLDPETARPDGAATGPVTAKSAQPIQSVRKSTIEFRNITFRYPGTERDVLCGVSFILRPGETLALVGENGAGKTTLVKLLARLYDPTGGEILLDGRDLRAWNLEDYYNQVGVIFQDFVRYDLSALENIGFGRIEDMNDYAAVRRAAEMGGALALVAGLPNGFDTMLGRRFEGGVDLSGGEWQKIALARAFMRDAGLLILDEPTAALDASAENEVFTRFAELTQGKTTVFVTHRLASVKMARKILVLKGGRLVEEGSHAELMACAGEYARMYKIQAERYRQDG